MLKYLFYLPPFLMNIITGILFFVPARRLAAAHESAVAVGAAMTVWAMAYALTSIVLGFFQNKKNAVLLILAGQALSILAFSGMLIFSELRLQYFWLVLTGFSTVMFYAPFQVIVDMLEEKSEGLECIVKSTSSYTFSWSLGLAAGPFLAAWIWGLFDPEKGWRICYEICIALNIVISAISCLLYSFVRRKNRNAVQPEKKAEETKEPAAEEEKKYPDHAIAGWIMGVAGYFAISALRSLFPFRGEVIQLTTGQQAILMAEVSFLQAVTALCFYKSKRWMYHPLPMILFTAAGIIGFVLAATAVQFSTLLFAMFLAGIFSGSFAWYMVYHALATPEKRGKYVSVNETIVGTAGIFAPLAGGLFATKEASGVPFLCGAVLVLTAVILHTAVIWKHRKI